MVRCPICKSELLSTPEASQWRPFCSQRCKTIDLGAWLDGTYRISRPIEEEDLDRGLTPSEVDSSENLH
jgi:hypothetical protein